jgi:hypothetical protein
MLVGLPVNEQAWLLGREDVEDVLWIFGRLDPQKALEIFRAENPDIDLDNLPPDRPNESEYSEAEREIMREIAARLIELLNA